MKKILGITFGGLQRKLVRLVLLVLLTTIAAFALISFYQKGTLTNLVEETRVEQQESISGISEEVMSKVMENSFAQMTVMQAEIAEKDFSEVVNNVYMIQSLAQGLFQNRNVLEPGQVGLPDPSMDGTASAMVLHEDGVDYTKSEYLGLAAHLSSSMIAMVNNSEKLAACYIGFADGTDLAVDMTASDKYDENGEVVTFPVRERPWYKGAVETGGLYFTGIIGDAFNEELLITCSVPVVVDDELIGVVGADIILESMDDFIRSSSDDDGIVLIIDSNGNVILSRAESGLFSAHASDEAVDLRESGNEELSALIRKALKETTELSIVTIDDKEYYIAGAPIPSAGWAMISVIEKEVTEEPEKLLLSEYDKTNAAASGKFKAGSGRTMRTSILIVVLIFLIGAAGALIAARNIVKPIEEMTRNINQSRRTCQTFEMKDVYKTDDEIELLAESFSELSRETKQYIQDITRITQEKERVNTELHMANRIQNSMIPSVFPPFPGREEFDIYASMVPAREVGGDFYDFYLIDEDHLCMIIADVSGKGVPAALFMMISKVILQSCAMLGQGASEILVKTNEAICSSNQVDMFITVWVGILEISTGKIEAANAGHEYPAVMRDGKFVLLKDKHGLVVGGLNDVKYKEYEIDLKPGDKLFVYTDGIPEATDRSENMFGTDRMLDALNIDPAAVPEQILKNVSEAVEDFVDGAEQFDDMTMLCMEYKGKRS